MGLIKSKFKGKKKNQNEDISSLGREGSDKDIVYTSQHKRDKENTDILEKLMKGNLDEFILNNLLMSIMFFDNDNGNPVSQPDNSLTNINLVQEHQKSHLKPDAMAEEVNRNVRFKPRHGPKKNISQPLLPQRMVIIYDNIQIKQNDDDDGHYSELDRPTFRARIEHTEMKGYLKLKCIKEEVSRRSSLNSESSNSTIYNLSQTSSVYGTINNARTLKPLEIGDQQKNLPKSIVRDVKKKRIIFKDNKEKEDEYTDQYLLSKVLMQHFLKFGFQKELAKQLGFTEEDLKDSMYTSSGIVCYEGGNKVLWEIIPAVLMLWPDAEKFAWVNRPDRRTLKTRKGNFQWPAKYMLNTVHKQNCVVIPRGYLPKTGVNEQSIFEWEMAFPQAERYLETRLTHPQIRSYLFLATLFKTFIEPKTERTGLLIEHIKNLIFWEVERDSISWPKEKLGTKLLKVIQTLISALGSSQMPNYFVRERNLFENIPSIKLYNAQDVLDLVYQSPVMYFIAALRNLEYVRDDFYKFPDLDQLRNYLEKSGTSDQTSAQEKEKKAKDEEKAKTKKEGETKKHVVEQASVSTDSLNFRWTAKCQKEDLGMIRLILKFFIKHFLTVVKDSIAHEAYAQAKLYVKHCFYLEKILEKNEPGNAESKDFVKEIRKFEIEIDKKEKQLDNPPLTPSRSSFYLNERNRVNSFTGSNRSGYQSYGSGSEGLNNVKKTQNNVNDIVDGSNQDSETNEIRVSSANKTQKKAVVFNFDQTSVDNILQNNEENIEMKEISKTSKKRVVNFIEPDVTYKKQNGVITTSQSEFSGVLLPETNERLTRIDLVSKKEVTFFKTNEIAQQFVKSTISDEINRSEITEINESVPEGNQSNETFTSERNKSNRARVRFAETDETNEIDSFTESTENSEDSDSSTNLNVGISLPETNESNGFATSSEANESIVKLAETNKNDLTFTKGRSIDVTETSKEVIENVNEDNVYKLNETIDVAFKSNESTEAAESIKDHTKINGFAPSKSIETNKQNVLSRDSTSFKESTQSNMKASKVDVISIETDKTKNKEINGVTKKQNRSAAPKSTDSTTPIAFIDKKEEIVNPNRYINGEPFVADEDHVVLRITNGVLQTRSKSLKIEQKKVKNDRSSAPAVLRLNTDIDDSEI